MRKCDCVVHSPVTDEEYAEMSEREKYAYGIKVFYQQSMDNDICKKFGFGEDFLGSPEFEEFHLLCRDYFKGI